jgi:hypothetical protein
MDAGHTYILLCSAHPGSNLGGNGCYGCRGTMMFYKFALKEIITAGGAQPSALTSDIQDTKHKALTRVV